MEYPEHARSVSGGIEQMMKVTKVDVAKPLNQNMQMMIVQHIDNIIMEKIKIVRRMLEVSQITPPTEEPIVVYDVYYGYTGIPSTWPLMTKWKIEMSGLNKNDMLRYMSPYLTNFGKVKIIVKDGGVQG